MRGRIPRAALVTVALSIMLTYGPQALCSVITIDAPAAVVYAQGDVLFGNDSTVAGTIAAGRSVTFGTNSDLQSIYARADIHLGESALVRGRVLAGGAAGADKGLDLQGSSWTGSGVSMGQDAVVAGDVIGASKAIHISQNSVVTGNILGNNDVQIDRGSAIYGDARPGLGHSLSTGRDVTITGSTAPGTVNADEVGPVALPAPPDAGAYGSQDVSADEGGVTTLDPGAYGSLSFGRGTTLNLSAGTYTLKDFWMDRESTVDIDATAGDVIINIHDSLATGHTVRFDVVGDGHLTLNVYGEDGIVLGHSNELAAAVRAWEGDFTADHGLTLIGSVWADNVSIGDGAGVQGRGPVPEPTALAILAFGGLLALRRRTR